MGVRGDFIINVKIYRKLVKVAAQILTSKKLTNERPVYTVIDQW